MSTTIADLALAQIAQRAYRAVYTSRSWGSLADAERRRLLDFIRFAIEFSRIEHLERARQQADFRVELQLQEIVRLARKAADRAEAGER